jgi:hypothetical protein
MGDSAHTRVQPTGKSISTAAFPMAFLEGENIFQKSARVVELGIVKEF